MQRIKEREVEEERRGRGFCGGGQRDPRNVVEAIRTFFPRHGATEEEKAAVEEAARMGRLRRRLWRRRRGWGGYGRGGGGGGGCGGGGAG